MEDFKQNKQIKPIEADSDYLKILDETIKAIEKDAKGENIFEIKVAS